MAQSFNTATREALEARLRFYRDLGLTEFYRRPVDPALLAQLQAIPVSSADSMSPESDPAPGSPLPTLAARTEDEETQTFSTRPSTAPEEQAIAARKSIATPPLEQTSVPVSERPAFLQIIREDIGDCTRCELHKGRHKIVFGDGSPAARLMFIGEGPGADEDAQGIPFVGKAGQLLNNMITAMGLKREEVYIANMVKCRPPGNRTPEPEEGNTCSQFLFRQIDVIRPQVLVALGATAATYLLGSRQPLAGVRGRVHTFRGSQLIITYHPAYLLRDPRQKKEAWADLQIAMRELGLKPPAKA